MAKITRGQFRRHRDHALGVNIRLAKSGGAKPTLAEAVTVLRAIVRTHKVPKGWKFAAVNWGNPRTATDNWREGNIHDLWGQLLSNGVLEAMLETPRGGIIPDTNWEYEIALEY